MTMQVSKGEFDRRVKLLEQKVQESANKLMSDYKTFVERVNAVVSENGDFNQYAAIVDRINSCFDTNGQFDGSHIAPLSIETAALSVGQRSQALNLKNVKFTISEYLRGIHNYGKLVISDENGEAPNNSYGTLTHYTLFNNENGEAIGDATFNIAYKITTNNSIPLYDSSLSEDQNKSLHYIYAQLPCTKESDGTYVYHKENGNNPTANIIVDIRQLQIEGNEQGENPPSTFPNCLWILLGTISKEFSGTRDGVGYKYRIVDLNYGLTTINGRLITTGRIEGSGDNHAYFDLDRGKIGGKIEFDSINTNGLLSLIGGATEQSVTDLEGWILYNKKLYRLHSSRTSRPSGDPKTLDNSDDPSNINWGNSWSETIPTTTSSYIWTCNVSFKYKPSATTKYKEQAIEAPIYDAGLTTDAIALSQSTTINGGLILSSKIQCGSGSATAGMMGISNVDYAFWAGNSNPDNANYWVKKNGSAKFGDLNIASDGILSFKNSSLVIQKSNYSVSFSEDSLERNVTIRSGDYNKSEQYIYDSEWNNGWGAATVLTDTDWIIVKVKFSGTYNISASTDGQIILTVKTEGSDATSSNKTISITNLSGSTIKNGTFNEDIYISYNPYYDIGLNKLNFIVTPSRTYGNTSGVVTINTLNIYIKYEFTLCVNAKEGFNIFNNGYTIYKKNARTLVFCGFDNNSVRFVKIVHSDGSSDDNRFIITTTSLLS